LLLPAAAAWFALSLRKRPSALVYSMASAMTRLSGRRNVVAGRLPLFLRTGCLLLLIFAAARPQLYNVSREVRSPGVDIMLCLDTSGSMRALDFKLNGKEVDRLTAVKKVVTEFLKKRESDRIGLVVFGEEAFTQAPLTMDKGLLLSLVERLTIGMAGDRTAIGSAIAVAGKRLKDIQAQSRLLILLTDGRHNAGELTPEAAAEAVRAVGVRIYTIGVGGTAPAPFDIQTPFGIRRVYERVDLDEETLRKVATIGQGRYFRASDSERLREIYDIIDRAEKTEIKMKEFFHFRELYPYLLIPALVLLMLEVLVRAFVWRTIP
jgi:Ca-activated chloride channel family protein